MSLHICINTRWCVCVSVCIVVCCFSDVCACAGKEEGRRNTELIKSLWDRDRWPNTHITHTHTVHTRISLENPPLLRGAVMCIVYLHNHLPFILSLSCSLFFLGKPVMIITEYMENGSLDAFLRVSHAFLSVHVVFLCATQP